MGEAARKLDPAWRLPGRAARVYAFLARHPGTTMSTAEIADELGMSRRTIFRALADLRAAGLLVDFIRKDGTHRVMLAPYRWVRPLEDQEGATPGCHIPLSPLAELKYLWDHAPRSLDGVISNNADPDSTPPEAIRARTCKDVPAFFDFEPHPADTWAAPGDGPGEAAPESGPEPAPERADAAVDRPPAPADHGPRPASAKDLTETTTAVVHRTTRDTSPRAEVEALPGGQDAWAAIRHARLGREGLAFVLGRLRAARGLRHAGRYVHGAIRDAKAQEAVRAHWLTPVRCLRDADEDALECALHDLSARRARATDPDQVAMLDAQAAAVEGFKARRRRSLLFEPEGDGLDAIRAVSHGVMRALAMREHPF